MVMSRPPCSLSRRASAESSRALALSRAVRQACRMRSTSTCAGGSTSRSASAKECVRGGRAASFLSPSPLTRAHRARPDPRAGLRDRVEGDRETRPLGRGAEEVLRRVPQLDRRATHISRDYVFAEARGPREYHPAAARDPRRERQGHLPDVRSHGDRPARGDSRQHFGGGSQEVYHLSGAGAAEEEESRGRSARGALTVAAGSLSHRCSRH